MSFLVRRAISLGQSRRFIQTSAVAQDAVRKWVWHSSGFNKYGLRADDLLDEEDVDVKEAIRRLPQNLVDERNYRQLRAIQLSIQKSILPKDQWTKYDEDKHYLKSYLEEVQAERREREEWERSH